MNRQLAVLALTALTTISLISPIFAIPPFAAYDGATRFSGIGYWAAPGECTDAHGDGADFALTMTGDLAGCLYTFVETSRCSAGGTYVETGNEVYVGFYNGSPGTFRTTYVYTAKYVDCANLEGEIFGRCQHPIIPGSGTGIFEGVAGRVDFRDDIEAENFPYRGHFRWSEPTASGSAGRNNAPDENTVGFAAAFAKQAIRL